MTRLCFLLVSGSYLGWTEDPSLWRLHALQFNYITVYLGQVETLNLLVGEWMVSVCVPCDGWVACPVLYSLPSSSLCWRLSALFNFWFIHLPLQIYLHSKNVLNLIMHVYLQLTSCHSMWLFPKQFSLRFNALIRHCNHKQLVSFCNCWEMVLLRLKTSSQSRLQMSSFYYIDLYAQLCSWSEPNNNSDVW